MAKQKRKKQRKRRIITPANCPFCDDKSTPNYKDYKKLSGFVTDRAKILGNAYTGVCSKHQRKLSVAIKRARHLGLLPFAPKVG